jgi:hypothetical protein
METIKIAPDLGEIRRNGNVFETEFNGMAIKWAVAYDCSDMDADTENNLKKWLQMAIGMSGKMWQVPYQLNDKLPFASEVFVNGKKVEYPKE